MAFDDFELVDFSLRPAKPMDPQDFVSAMEYLWFQSIDKGRITRCNGFYNVEGVYFTAIDKPRLGVTSMRSIAKYWPIDKLPPLNEALEWLRAEAMRVFGI